MRRGVKGGTTHPALPRPGYGYGRPLRPSPERRAGAERDWREPATWFEHEDALDLTGRTEVTAERP